MIFGFKKRKRKQRRLDRESVTSFLIGDAKEAEADKKSATKATLQNSTRSENAAD